MNVQQRAAMQMALEAMEGLYGGWRCTAAIKACREALAQPQGEPVASVVAMLDKCISIIGTEMVRCTQAGDKWFMCQRFIHAIQDMQYEFKRDYAAQVDVKAILETERKRHAFELSIQEELFADKAEAIRAEALEEAAAMGEESIRIWGDQDGRMVEVVAAIRRLK